MSVMEHIGAATREIVSHSAGALASTVVKAIADPQTEAERTTVNKFAAAAHNHVKSHVATKLAQRKAKKEAARRQAAIKSAQRKAARQRVWQTGATRPAAYTYH